MVHSAVLSSIPRRCRSIPSVHFRTRLENTSPSAQCVARGLSPYRKSKTSPGKNASTLRMVHSAVLSSIPQRCRSISLAGFRPIENQKRTPGRMQALSIDLPRRADLDSAPLVLHLGRGLSPYRKPKTNSGKNASTLRMVHSAVLSSIPRRCRSISLAGFRPMKITKSACTRVNSRQTLFIIFARLIAITKALTSRYIIDSRFL